MASEGLSRRKLLGAAAATGLAASCKSGVTPAIERSFVGQDPERGHLLRARSLLDSEITERIAADVVIVGGGVAGAAAAWRLRNEKLRVHLIELEDELGGTARGSTLPRSAHPLGAHYLPVPRRDFVELEGLLEDLGVLRARDAKGRAEYDTTAITAAPLERHYFEGRWFDGLYPHHGQSAEEERQFESWLVHLRELDARRGPDGRRLFTIPVERSSTQLRHLDEITMAEYLDRRGLDSWRLRWLVDYACRDDYGLRIDECSAFAALHHFLARGFEDAEDRFILAWPEGNAHLVHGMMERADLGDRVHRPAAAYRVDPDSGEVRVRRVDSDTSIAIDARVVLWAAPRFVLRYALPTPSLDSVTLSYTPWLVANLELKEAPGGVGAPLAWDNVPVLRTDEPVSRWPANLGYVLANHAEAAGAPKAGAVITYYEPMSALDDDRLKKRRADLLAGDVQRWSEHAITELERMHPSIRNTVSRISVTRWGHAMIRPVPGLLFGSSLAAARAPIGRIVPCATDTSGLPLFEEAFYAGTHAAELALARLGGENDSPG